MQQDQNAWDAGDTFLDALGGPVPAASERIAAFMAKLNDDQKRAVECTDGALMVIAGAGTGKTRMLTSKIAYLIEHGMAEPEEILAVTFTNKAAAEMRDRILAMIGERARRIRMGSFHAISLYMLRHHPRAAGLRDDNFVVLDETDQQNLVASLMEDSGLRPDEEDDGRTRKRASKAWKDMVRQFHSTIQTWKEEGWDLETVTDHVDPGERDNARIMDIYRSYQRALQARNACDFADLLLHMVKLFREEPEIRAQWAGRYRYILVDEFQDTNYLQYEWLKHLAQDHGNLCVVGDPDQSIYEWRGARPEILLNFSADWPGCKMLTVDRNYRSTQPILDVANAVVAENPRPAPKALQSPRSGDPVHFNIYDTHWDEARGVVGDIAARIARGQRAGEIAILVRSAALMRPFEEQVIRNNLAYMVVGGLKFHEREEIKDTLAYLRVAVNPRDELAFMRIANKPTRNIGDATAQQVAALVRDGSATTLAEACRHIARHGRRIQKTTALSLENFASLLEEIGALAGDATLRPGDVIDRILKHIGYIAWRISIEDENVREREESLEEMIRDANDYTDLMSYLQTLALLTAADIKAKGEAVRISTIHAAKGLEFETVYTPCLEDGVLPNARSMREARYGLQEERRIAHVAWTRAKNDLMVSCAAQRHNQRTMPSPFLMAAGLYDEDTGLPIRRVERRAAPATGYGIRRSTAFGRRF